MKKWLAMLAAASCALSFAALAADAPATKAPTAQQQKMTTCNAEAKTKALKGDERKAFMKECLSAKKAAAAPATQQDKMKTCNADAKTKKLAAGPAGFSFQRVSTPRARNTASSTTTAIRCAAHITSSRVFLRSSSSGSVPSACSLARHTR